MRAASPRAESLRGELYTDTQRTESTGDSGTALKTLCSSAKADRFRFSCGKGCNDLDLECHYKMHNKAIVPTEYTVQLRAKILAIL